MIKQIRNTLINWKIYIGRSATYISLLNMGMIVYIFLNTLRDNQVISFEIREYIIPIILASFVIWIIFGWFDMYFLKAYQAEVNQTNALTPLHPELMEMKQKINELWSKR